MRFNSTLRHARLDAIETVLGASPVLEIRTGSAPTAITDADAGTLLASLTLPADFMENAGATTTGLKGLSGTWEATAVAQGTPGHFRLKTSGGTAVVDGSAGTASTDLILASATIDSGQVVTITSFDVTDGNA